MSSNVSSVAVAEADEECGENVSFSQQEQRYKEFPYTSTEQTDVSSTLLLSNLTRTVSENHIREIAACFGTVLNVTRLSAFNDKSSKFSVVFKTRDEAEIAMKHLYGGQIDGQPLDVFWPQSLSKTERSHSHETTSNVKTVEENHDQASPNLHIRESHQQSTSRSRSPRKRSSSSSSDLKSHPSRTQYHSRSPTAFKYKRNRQGNRSNNYTRQSPPQLENRLHRRHASRSFDRNSPSHGSKSSWSSRRSSVSRDRSPSRRRSKSFQRSPSYPHRSHKNIKPRL